jgi:kynurenine formamidase
MCSPTCLEALYGPASRRGFVKKSIMAAAAVTCGARAASGAARQPQRISVRYAWLGSGRWGVEAVANLDALPSKGAILVLEGPRRYWRARAGS